MFIRPRPWAIAIALLVAAQLMGCADKPELVTALTLRPCEESSKAVPDDTAEIIRTRLAAWGGNSVVQESDDGIVVKVGELEAERAQTLRRVLIARGGFAFHGAIDLADDSAPPLASLPDSYFQPRLSTPTSGPASLYVDREAIFTAPLVRMPEVVDTDRYSGDLVLSLPIGLADQDRLGDFTETRIGEPLAIMVDDQLMLAPVVRGPVRAAPTILVDTSAMDLAYLKAIVSAPALSTCLRIDKEESISEPFIPTTPPTPRAPIIDENAVAFLEKMAIASEQPLPAMIESGCLEIRMKIPTDSAAIARYFWESPDREQVHMTVDYRHVDAGLNSGLQIGWETPIELLDEYLENAEPNLLGLAKTAGRIVLAGRFPNRLGLHDEEVPILHSLQATPPELIEEGYVDLLYRIDRAGPKIILRGIDHTPYAGESMTLRPIGVDECCDSIIAVSPDRGTIISTKSSVRDGTRLFDEIEIRHGNPENPRSPDVVIEYKHEKHAGTWIITQFSSKGDGEPQFHNEVISFDADCDLSKLDWSDELIAVGRDLLIEERASREKPKPMTLREIKALEEALRRKEGESAP